MSTNPSPTQIIQALYAAFARGDVAAIVARLRSDVEWRINADLASPGAHRIPTLRPRRGPHEAAEFFNDLATFIEMHEFQPLSFMAGDREVAVRVLVDATVRPTGRRLKFEAIHHWTLDEAGRVTRFLDFLDTLAEADAWAVIEAKS